MTGTERRRRLRGLYAITPETDDLGRLLGLVRLALDGGARLVQYRAKRRDPRSPAAPGESRTGAVPRARRALHRERRLSNSRLAIDADGVHLGRDDVDARAARRRLPNAILGVSCYDDPALALAAAEAGADYAAIGSVFASPTKPGAIRAGLPALAEARRLSGIPIAAIGGITPANAAEAVAAGADMLAVISALFEAPDVACAARALSRPFDTEPDSHVRAQQTAL